MPAPTSDTTVPPPAATEGGLGIFDAPRSSPSGALPSPASDAGPAATPPASAASTDPGTGTTPAGAESALSPASEATPSASTPGSGEKERAQEERHMAAARRLGDELAKLKREFQVLAEENRVLRQKVEGTEPPAPSPEELERRAELRGREAASRPVAVALFGEDAVQAQVYADDSPYKRLVTEKPWIHARVMSHEQPVVEAMRVLAEEAFRAQYGPDPAQWAAKVEAALRPKILEELRKQVAAPVTGAAAPTISQARGGSETGRAASIEELFYGKTGR